MTQMSPRGRVQRLRCPGSTQGVNLSLEHGDVCPCGRSRRSVGFNRSSTKGTFVCSDRRAFTTGCTGCTIGSSGAPSGWWWVETTSGGGTGVGGERVSRRHERKRDLRAPLLLSRRGPSRGPDLQTCKAVVTVRAYCSMPVITCVST